MDGRIPGLSFLLAGNSGWTCEEPGSQGENRLATISAGNICCSPFLPRRLLPVPADLSSGFNYVSRFPLLSGPGAGFQFQELVDFFSQLLPFGFLDRFRDCRWCRARFEHPVNGRVHRSLQLAV